jgi:copper chaperone
MGWTLTVDNIKCGGCAGTIRKEIGLLAGITAVEADPATGEVRLEGDESARPVVSRRLRELGYPERGSVSGMGSAAAMAKSFVSCTIGRLA